MCVDGQTDGKSRRQHHWIDGNLDTSREKTHVMRVTWWRLLILVDMRNGARGRIKESDVAYLIEDERVARSHAISKNIRMVNGPH